MNQIGKATTKFFNASIDQQKIFFTSECHFVLKNSKISMTTSLSHQQL